MEALYRTQPWVCAECGKTNPPEIMFCKCYKGKTHIPTFKETDMYPAETQVLGQIPMPTLTQQLAERKKRAEQELADVNKLIAMLEKNPELQEMFDMMTKLGRVRY
jgi:hypothetical protein